MKMSWSAQNNFCHTGISFMFMLSLCLKEFLQQFDFYLQTTHNKYCTERPVLVTVKRIIYTLLFTL